MSTQEGMTQLRDSVLAAWPAAADWEDFIWKGWQRELRSFTDEELEAAVRKLARGGRINPPGWGMIYAAALPARTARLAREQERRWMDDAP